MSSAINESSGQNVHKKPGLDDSLKYFSPKKVARSIGVSESSLKRWCDAGHIQAIKTAGGHRRITKADVVAYIRQSKNQIVEPEALGLPNINTVEIVDYADAQNQLFGAILAGNEERCRTILMHLFISGVELADLFDHVVSPTFQRVGEKWDCGDISVYQERRGCVMCLNACQDLRGLLKPHEPDAPVAIGASTEGDHYMLPTTAVELVLKSEGWNAENLGSNLPFSSLIEAAQTYRPSLFWLSVSHLADEAAFVAGFNQFAENVSPGTFVVIGGNSLTTSIRSRINNAICCDNLSQLATTVRGLKTALSERKKQDGTVG